MVAVEFTNVDKNACHLSLQSWYARLSYNILMLCIVVDIQTFTSIRIIMIMKKKKLAVADGRLLMRVDAIGVCIAQWYMMKDEGSVSSTCRLPDTTSLSSRLPIDVSFWHFTRRPPYVQIYVHSSELQQNIRVIPYRYGGVSAILFLVDCR